MDVRQVMTRGVFLALLAGTMGSAACSDIVVGGNGDGAGGDFDAAIPCEYGDDSTCDDGNSCTIDECLSDGTCQHTARPGVCKIDGECFDPAEVSADNPCKVCDPGRSKSDWSALECDDGDPCTVDFCDANDGCMSTAAPDGSVCVDEACPLPGTCAAGACDVPCEAGNCGGIDCSTVAGPCAVSACIDNRCVVEPRPAGAACAPTNPCITNAACDAVGNCVGDWDDTCTCATDADCDDGLPCTTDSCDPATGCSYQVDDAFCQLLGSCFPEGAHYPADACWVCDAGQPDGWTPLSCDDGDPCSYDSCSRVTGCVHDEGALCCTDDGDCGNAGAGPCERATCINGSCVVAANKSLDGSACDDGDPCTQLDLCAGGVCAGTAVDCAEGDPCAFGTCDPFTGACSSAPLPTGAACDDGNPCTAAEKCDEDGTCVGFYDGTISGCSCNGDDALCDDELDCTTDTCLASGLCENTPGAGSCVIGGACYADGEASANDACQVCDASGDATTWTTLDCDDGNPCTTDSCDAAAGCQNVAVDDGTACDDGDPCSTDEACTGGVCVGTCGCTTVADCTGDPGPCKQWLCNDSVCEAVPDDSQEGQACEDGQFCTTGETCTSGSCGGGAATDCSGEGDGVCMVGQCDEDADACVAIAAPNGTSCDDGVNCTESDVCTAGVCGGTDKDCSALETECKTASCQESDGQCVATPNDGVACDDGDACTLSDTCNAAGLCVGTWDDVNCGCDSDDDCASFSDACNTGRCEVATNTCYADPNVGDPCDDGNPCTETDACLGDGSCGGTSYACNAPLTCMASACDGAGGCDETINPGFCVIGGACYSDGTANPGNPCQVCNAGASQTSWSNGSDGTPCDADGNGCTDGDSCQAGSCVAGVAVQCASDGLSCTDEVCTSTGPNSHTCGSVANGNGCYIGSGCYNNGVTNPNNECQRCTQSAPTGWSNKSAGASCGDATSNGCTSPDTCDGSGSCQPNHASNGTNCGSAPGECTNWDTCQNGTCVDNGHKASGTACGSSANNACTSPDTCNGSGTCQPNHAANGTNCGSTPGECTNWDTCQNGSCVDNGHKPSGTSCGSSTNNACTDPDTCNGSGTCLSNNVANGTNCGSTPNECTNWDTCQNGSCVDNGYKPNGAACGSSTNNACTNPDTCNGSGTCKANHAANGTNCGPTPNECTNWDTCQSGSCVDNGYKSSGAACGSSASSACDAPDTCDGSGACQDNQAQSGTSCGAQAYCDESGACCTLQCQNVPPNCDPNCGLCGADITCLCGCCGGTLTPVCN